MMIVVGGSTILWVVLWVASVANGRGKTSKRFWSQRRQAPLLQSTRRTAYFESLDYFLLDEPEERGPPRQRTNAKEERKNKVLGVTALLELPSDLSQVAGSETTDGAPSPPLLQVLVGDKRGQVRILQLEFKEEEKDPSGSGVAETTLLSSLTHNANSKLPVFSLAVERETANVFVGGGDRYISVWKQQQTKSSEVDAGWNQIQRLGQHTGWVKAIAACPSTTFCCDGGPRLYSIGCNRVEVWERNIDEDGWRNLETVSIDSSPNNAVCTLSSDLLCLTHCRCRLAVKSSQSIDLLVAGGVDGRLHFFWNAENGRMKPARVVSAHAGRVNALHFDASSQFLFSVSHDAAIHCWHLVVEQIDARGDEGTLASLSVSLMATHKIKGDSRITALTCWRRDYDNLAQDDTTSDIRVAVGTNKGFVSLLSLVVAKELTENSCQFKGLQDVEIANENNDDFGTVDPPAVVTALCRLESRRVLVVGHSRGLGYISMN